MIKVFLRLSFPWKLNMLILNNWHLYAILALKQWNERDHVKKHGCNEKFYSYTYNYWILNLAVTFAVI